MPKYNPNIPGQELQRNGQWQSDCPICGKPGHFYMNSNTGLWDCKKCGESGNFWKFKKFMKDGEFKQDEPSAKKNLLEVKTTLDFDEVEKEIEESETSGLILPTEFKEISKDTKKAYDYLSNRNFNLKLIQKYNLMYCESGIYWNRIIVPVYMGGVLRGFLGRFIPIEGISGDDIKRKYRNSYGTDFSKLLWNYDSIKYGTRKPVVILEGAFGGIRINHSNTVATFGKKVSDYQIELLKAKKVKEILLLFDDDAYDEIDKYGAKLMENFLVKTYPLKDGQDIDNFDNSDGKLWEKLLRKSRVYKYKHLVSVKKFK